MADPIEFDPYLEWVDVSDPNNIPEGARVVGASDLLRYEKLGQDVTARLNDTPALVADLAPGIASAPSVVTAIAGGTVAPPGAARMNAAALANGIPATMSETGQAVTSFGNTPLTVQSGAITHTPVANTPASNLAGYMQSKTKSGGKVKGIWAIVQASATANTGLALVLPTAPWANNSLTPAQVHHVEYPNGNWHTSIWTGSAENPKYLPDAVAGSWNDGKPRLVAAIVNELDNSVTIRHADGSISQSAPGVIDASLLSEYGIVESYRFVNTSADPAVAIKILRWGLIDQTDITNLVSLGIPSYRDIAKAITAAAPPVKQVSKVAPNTDIIATSPVTSTNGTLVLADVTDDAAPGVAIAKVTGVASADGCMLITASAYIEMDSAATNYWWALSGNGNGRGAQIVVKNRTWMGRASTIPWKVTGLTPGSTNTFTLQHGLSQTATTGRIKAGGGTGYLIMTADPCAA